jgi:hypothetical protein
VVSARTNALVINGGYTDHIPYAPLGLLLVAGKLLDPASFEKRKDGFYALSEIVCETATGALSFHETKEFDPAGSPPVSMSPASIATQCASAFQTGPSVVDLNGVRAITQNDVINKQPHTRTMLGQSQSGDIEVIIFPRPIHLFVASDFLRTPPGTATSGPARTSDILGDVGDVHTSSGLGLALAVNLDGDANSFCLNHGKVVVGNIDQPIPSAVVFEPGDHDAQVVKKAKRNKH